MEYCLEVNDYSGCMVRFEESNRLCHALKHPELDDPRYIKGRVRNAIIQPTFVYKAINRNKRLVNYLFEYNNNGTNVYTKVVIQYRGQTGYIATAFRISYVKERNKTDIIYGEDK